LNFTTKYVSVVAEGSVRETGCFIEFKRRREIL